MFAYLSRFQLSKGNPTLKNIFLWRRRCASHAKVL